ncbi:MAG: hypothetical protein IT375_20320 [Polyangiaceae bacterium]|nr:hypothetical protein [Polyangiaceae bacterium]
MSTKKIARKTKTTKARPSPLAEVAAKRLKEHTAKMAAKAAKPEQANGAADPSLADIHAALAELNAKLQAAGKDHLRVGYGTQQPEPERDPRRTVGGQLIPDHDVELALLKEEADPPTDDVCYQPLGDLVARVLSPAFVTYEPTHPAHWSTLDQGLLRVTELELRALAIALQHEAAPSGSLLSDSEVAFTQEDAVGLLVAISHRLSAGVELSSRMREARWGDPRFGGYDPKTAKRISGDDGETESEAAS